MMEIDFSLHFEIVACLWISNEKYGTTVLMELSKSCLFSGKEGLSPAALQVVKMDC
jgi:hypothetical protein